ncbi:FAD binding domain protein, partial [Amniculicola lignicola CBS 123094]
PEDSCWPSPDKWSSLNTSLSGALIRGVPPGAVCYQAHPTYNENHCEIVRSQWFNSTWHAQDPISVDYPIWTDNSCNPIYPNGTSVTGDVEAGKKGCSIGRYSVYVVNATTAEHASKALKWAQKHNIRVVVKSTGHSFPGRSTGYGSLSIWTHNLRGIQYTESFSPTKCPVKEPLKAVRVAAGHTGIEVQAEVAKSNVIIVTGANPDVGLIGWLTGGGHGVLSTSYGMGADNLLEATIVTPDGKTLVANPCQNSDLFFAIRGGGGGTFGVVLEAIVQAFPTPKTTLFTFAFAFIGTTEESQYWDLVGFIHAEMARLKEGGMQGYYYMPGPPVYPTLAFQGGFYLYNKPEGTVETLVAPIVARLVERPDLFVYQSSIRHSDTFWDSYNGVIENEQVATGGAAFGSRLLSPESLADPNATAKAFAEIGARLNPPTPNVILIGHMIASPNEPTYYPSAISMNPAWRNTLVHFVVVEGWPEGVDRSLIDAVYEEITYNKTEVLRQLSPNTGAYFNEADSYEPKWQESFFGKHYARLRKIKEKYDPHNILWCMRCVGSEALVEQQNGRLCK